MHKRQWTSFAILCVIGVLGFCLAWGCARKTIRTRETDREEINKILAKLEDGVARRKPDAFEKVVGLSFDGAAFVDAVWSAKPEGIVSFRTVRLRIAEDEARVVLEITHAPNDSTQDRKYLGLDLLYRENRWKFTAFQEAGSQPEL